MAHVSNEIGSGLQYIAYWMLFRPPYMQHMIFTQHESHTLISTARTLLVDPQHVHFFPVKYPGQYLASMSVLCEQSFLMHNSQSSRSSTLRAWMYST